MPRLVVLEKNLGKKSHSFWMCGCRADRIQVFVVFYLCFMLHIIAVAIVVLRFKINVQKKWLLKPL